MILSRRSSECTATSVDWSFSAYAVLMTGSAEIRTSNARSMLLIGRSTFELTAVLTTMRPDANETSSGPRVQRYGRSLPSSENVPSPALGTTPSSDGRRPAPESATCAVTREGDGSATSGVGCDAGRLGYTGPKRVQLESRSSTKNESDRTTRARNHIPEVVRNPPLAQATSPRQGARNEFVNPPQECLFPLPG